MQSIFKQQITDFHTTPLPEPLSRTIKLPALPPHVRKAIALIGMRRSGKTWMIYQIIHQLIKFIKL
jgi:hypothetical protein